MNWLRVLCVPVMLALASCSNIPVTIDYDEQYDFSTIGSYALIPTPATKSPQPANSLVRKRIERAIRDELLDKKLLVVHSSEADVWINYFMTSREALDVRAYSYGHRYRCYRCGYSSVHVSRYTEGTMVLEVIDRRGSAMIWQATSQGRLAKGLKPEERNEKIRERIHAMLASFPPN